mgnify:CR=1 FL=1
MHAYRTHTCGELRKSHVGTRARLSGWVHRARDHGGLLFIDLRDHYGLTQCVIEPDSQESDSFADGLLEGPQYTRPERFRGASVPSVLLSGHHAEVARWRRMEQLRRTLLRRPDLLATAALNEQDRADLQRLATEPEPPT